MPEPAEVKAVSQSPPPMQLPLQCSCGEAHTLHDMMLRHIEATGHALSDGELARINAKLQHLEREAQATRIRLGFLEHDRTSLGKLYALAGADKLRESLYRAKPRPCIDCRKPTVDRFGNVARCSVHIAGGDRRIGAILDTLLNT